MNMRHLLASLVLLIGASSCAGLAGLRTELESVRAEIHAAQEEIARVETETPEALQDLRGALSGALDTVDSVGATVSALERTVDAGKDLAFGIGTGDAVAISGSILALLEAWRRSRKAVVVAEERAVERVHRERDEARRSRNEVTGGTLARAAPPMAAVPENELGALLEMLRKPSAAGDWLAKNPPPAA